MIAWCLVLFRVFPETWVYETVSSGPNGMTAPVDSMRFPICLHAFFIGAIALGTLLLILPRREKTNA